MSRWCLVSSLALLLCLAHPPSAVRAQTVDCSVLPGPSVGPEMDLTGLSKDQLERHLASVELEQADLIQERERAGQTIETLGGESGLQQDAADRQALADETWRQIETVALPQEYKDRPGLLPQATEAARKRFATNEAFRQRYMERVFQNIGKAIDENRAAPGLAQQFGGLCDQYPDLKAWDQDVETRRDQLARAQALSDPDCWTGLRERYAAALRRLKGAIEASGELELVALEGMLKKIHEEAPLIVEDMRATQRYMVEQDEAARNLLLELESHARALANGWQPPSPELLRELEKMAERSTRDMLIHHKTVIQFLEVAEETAAAAFWKQKLGGREVTADQLEDYLDSKRQFSLAEHDKRPDDAPHGFVGLEAFHEYATQDTEGKNDATARAVRDILANE